MGDDGVFSEVKGYRTIDEKKGIRIDELKRSIPIATVLKHYGGQTPPEFSHEWQAMCCPFHKDTRPSASVNYRKQRFVCHTCDVSGDVVDLVSTQEGLSTKQAMEFLRERFL